MQLKTINLKSTQHTIVKIIEIVPIAFLSIRKFLTRSELPTVPTPTNIRSVEEEIMMRPHP